jgi:phage replication-related protein YjqB (UPF0714/DUF867 family)
VAGEDHGWYSFTGIRESGNHDLHIPSTRFEEPQAIAMAASADVLLVIHGCRDREPIVYPGGRDEEVIAILGRRLASAGIRAELSDRFPGRHPENLCNRFPGVRGLQLEVSRPFRDQMNGRVPAPPPPHPLVTAMRSALNEIMSLD